MIYLLALDFIFNAAIIIYLVLESRKQANIINAIQFIKPKRDYIPTGKLELCSICNTLKDTVKMTKESRTACKECRMTVLRLAE